MPDLGAEKQLLSEHLGLLLAGIPLVVVAAKILIVARGNSSALAQIIQDVDASQVLLATVTSALLPVLQTLMATFGSTRLARIAYGAPVSSDLNFIVGVLTVSVVLTAIVQPWNSAVIALGFVMVVVFGDPIARWIARSRRRKERTIRDAVDGADPANSGGNHRKNTDENSGVPSGLAFIQSPLFMLALLGLLILSQPSWLPAEEVTVHGKSARTASILKEDGAVLSVLWSNSTVERIELSAITSRVICRRTPRSLFSLVNSDAVDKAPPKCVD